MNKTLTAIKTGYERGFDLYCEDQHRQACEVWLETWTLLRDYVREHQVRSTTAFVKACAGDNFIDNFIGDLDIGLVRACMMQRGRAVSPKYMRRRLAWAEECLELFSDAHEPLRRTFQVSIAESHAFLGEPEKCDARFTEIMAADPDWILGYIFWSDRHRLGRQTPQALQQAEAILKRGLTHVVAEDAPARLTFLERLADVCRRADRHEEADNYQAQCAEISEALEGDDDDEIEPEESDQRDDE